MEKRKNLAVVCLTAAFLLGFLIWGLCKPDDAVSVSERRKLAQKPELTLSSVLRGEFMTKFETYTLDQFPLRDSFRRLQAVTPYASMIDLTPALSLDSYYHTDLHWRQEALLPVARTLAKALGVTLTEDYETITADQPFYGVYCGQSALPLEPEPLRYLTNDTLRGCTVYDYETGSELPVYDLQQLAGEDAYAVFLSGSKALLTITNPAAKTDRELVVFRDSFASSLTPLLAGAYAKITLVDIRYLQPERLGTWLTFDTQDVLFLYSAPVLNSSETIR